MARIYTRGGDSGDTGLFGGERVRKHDPRVASCGDVDELSAALGVARAALPAAAEDVGRVLEDVQRELLALGALLADPSRADVPPAEERLRLDERHVARLERQVDAWEGELAPLASFILPAGHAGAAALHAARAVCRRAERGIVALGDAGLATGIAVPYLNRLSDALFVAARVVNRPAGLTDVPW